MRQNSLVFFFLTVFIALQAQSSLNVDLFTQFHRGDARYSGSWSYVAPDGSEYALLGTRTGTAVYAIDDQNEIEEVGFIEGGSSNWREIIVIGAYAYVSTESNAADVGMQVIDLTNLPTSVSLLTNYTETFSRGHIIQKDIFSDAPYIYVIGTTATEGVHILDVSDPANPVEIGLYQPGYYIHDVHVRGDILFASAFYEGNLEIVDISDKTNPQIINSIPTPGGRTHSCSMSTDGKYLFIAPELDGLLATVWNIEDFDNPELVATYSANTESLVHNPYILGDFAFISHNTEGLRVVDFTDPELPVEVGYYDTFEGPSGGFNGLWSACPYLPSGKIIGGNRENGLYVWTFNGTRAARLYGLVQDAFTQDPIFDASVEIIEVSQNENTLMDGVFKFGNLAGTYTFHITADGYEAQTISMDLAEGSQEILIVDLVPFGVTDVNNAFTEKINVFPNPVQTHLTIDLGDQQFEGSINLINSQGQRMQQIAVLPEQSNLTIERRNIAAGIYWLEFREVNGTLMGVKKVVVQ